MPSLALHDRSANRTEDLPERKRRPHPHPLDVPVLDHPSASSHQSQYQAVLRSTTTSPLFGHSFLLLYDHSLWLRADACAVRDGAIPGHTKMNEINFSTSFHVVRDSRSWYLEESACTMLTTAMMTCCDWMLTKKSQAPLPVALRLPVTPVLNLKVTHVRTMTSKFKFSFVSSGPELCLLTVYHVDSWGTCSTLRSLCNWRLKLPRTDFTTDKK